MKYYVIINGVSSESIQGLAIESLPAISKPLQRSKQETIDGRDGDIITKLGYAAYDKTLKIGLWGNYDINDIIEFFNQEGTITFSNEPDMIYNFNILNRIDFINQLETFRKATITIHCQPFKYKEEETQTLELQEHQATGTDFNLDGTYATSLGIDLKGNTEQVQLSGKNKLIIIDEITASNGIKSTYDFNTGVLNCSGTAETNWPRIVNYHELNNVIPTNTTLTFSLDSSTSYSITLRLYYNTSQYESWTIQENKSSITNTLSHNIIAIAVFANYGTDTVVDINYKLQLEYGSTPTSFEKYVGGIPSPNPDYPQQVNVVSGNNTIKICGKNIFDKDNPNIISGYYLNDDGVETSNSNFNISDYMNVIPNTIYSLQPYRNNTACLCYYDENKTFISSTRLNTINPNFTTPINAKYIKLSFRYDTHDIQIEKGSTATTYEAYQSQTYPITLPAGMELCKIGNYQDSFVYDNDKWYKRANVGKNTLTEITSWTNNPSGETLYQGVLTIQDNMKSQNWGEGYSNLFVRGTTKVDSVIRFGANNRNVYFYTNSSHFSSKETADTFLTSNPITFYYILDTQTDTEITDTTLINQLEAIRLNALSYNGTTNILQTNNDLPFILDIDYFTGTNEITITNNGNTYSKPVLTLVGSGVIGIYLNDSQIFQVSLGTNETIIIDINNMEAYYDATLKNRQVIGDYNNFKLIAGENKIKLTGNWDKLNVDNYSRWI